jgi:hypothetical protein
MVPMVQSFMEGGHVDIKINDQIGENFQTKKGVRQGDPLSSILFNIVVDMLVVLIKRAKIDGQIEGMARQWATNSSIRRRYDIVYGS